MTLLEKLFKFALESLKDEYSELCDNWRSIDTKAQGNIAVCGIFIAGSLAFVRTLPDTPDQNTLLLLTVAILCLLFSTVLSLLVLKVRTVPSAPSGTEISELVNDLTRPESFEQDDYERFLGEQLRMWQKTNEKVFENNRDKVRCLFLAQLGLMAALFVSVATAIYETWN